MGLIVVDASVFNKLFLDELDRPEAVSFFRHVLTHNLDFGAPEILKLEACQSALHYNHPFNTPLKLLDKYVQGGFQWVDLTNDHWNIAEEISRHGHKKSGYPTLIDSLYHAVSIVENGVFITADKRHVSKTQSFGHTVLLSSWKTYF